MFSKWKEQSFQENDRKVIDQIRSLGLDMIMAAQSGHPGIVLGAAPIIYTLYKNHLQIDPNNPDWMARDRFILSAGHGSALLYATLFMAGHPLTLDDLKQFRHLHSKTPGHPELGITPGVDMSTGPLGQGIATAVGMAIGERYLNHYSEEKKFPNLLDHYTYVLCGDGDLMEGVSYEATSLAGTLRLNKLIVLYDSNHVSLDGDTKMTFTENVKERFTALGWNVISDVDGEDCNDIDHAISKAKTSSLPSIIIVSTTIGKYSKYQGTSKVHGAPLEEEDLQNVKKQLEVRDIPFTVSQEAIDFFQTSIQERMSPILKEWYTKYEKLEGTLQQELTALNERHIEVSLKDFALEIPENHMESTRVSSGKILNHIASSTPFFLGGSADLSSSTKTYLKENGDFSSSNPGGRNIWYGVREHAMAAISNGLALMGLLPFASTFLVFSDYLKPAIRMSALMNLRTLYIFTHDSITVGQDGPTHQPVEQLVALRAIPNLEVFRPADGNEVLGCYKAILEKKEGPSALILSRNDVEIMDSTKANEVSKGAYIVRKEEKYLQGILIATGEEVALALSVSEKLSAEGIDTRVVSMPSIERFLAQPNEYQAEILPTTIKTVVLEAGSSYSWYRFVYNEKYLVNVNEFGLSGTKDEISKAFQIDFDSVFTKIEKLFR